MNLVSLNSFILNINPLVYDPANIGYSLLYKLPSFNVIIGGNCGLPKNFNVASSNVIYNITESGFALIGVLDSEGRGLAVITVNITDNSCSLDPVPIINLQ